MKRINAIKKYKNDKGETRYRFTIRVDKEHVTSRQGKLTYEDAALAYNNLQHDIMTGKYKAAQKLFTYNEIYEAWLKSYVNKVRSTTYYLTRRMFERYIIPEFGNKLISKISVRDCQQAVDKWSTQIATFNPIVSRASSIFEEAVKYDYISKNPMKRVDIPRKTKKMDELSQKKDFANFYSLDELQKFLEESKKINFECFVIFRLLSYSGMRIGECLAMKWDHINFENKTIDIDKTLVYQVETNSFTFDPPKNGKSRSIIIDDETLDILLKWQQLQKEFYQKKFEFIFTNPQGELYNASTVGRWQQDINTKIKLGHKVTPHGFRHTNATLLYANNPNITPKDIQNRLGHSNISISMNIYEHVTKDSDDKIREALNKFNKKSKNTTKS